MTVEEWYAMDKKPGMKLRTSDGKIGKLVSVHKDGATLDFTNGETYTHVVRSFYRCVQLSKPGDPVPAEPAKPRPRTSGISTSKCRGRVLRVKTGDVFASANDARASLGLSPGSILRSCLKGVPVSSGAYKGEYFKLLEVQQ